VRMLLAGVPAAHDVSPLQYGAGADPVLRNLVLRDHSTCRQTA
jgi:hypothetical protein